MKLSTQVFISTPESPGAISQNYCNIFIDCGYCLGCYILIKLIKRWQDVMFVRIWVAKHLTQPIYFVQKFQMIPKRIFFLAIRC